MTSNAPTDNHSGDSVESAMNQPSTSSGLAYSGDLEFIKSQKGKSMVIHLGHAYNLQKTLRDNVSRYLCVESKSGKCHGALLIDRKDKIKHKYPHNHEGCPSKVRILKVCF